MKKLFSFLFIFTFVLNFNFAQTALSTAVDFSVTDRFGEEHNLYQILEDGKYVLIDFFAHYCSPCCDITPDINKVYYNFGCNDLELHVISIEGAGNLSQLESFENTCGGTTEKPVVTGVEGNGIQVATDYQLGFYPTVIVIAPNKEIVVSDIWPFSYQIVKTKLETLGIFPAECRLPDSVEDVSGISSIKLTPNPTTLGTTLEFNLNEANLCQIQLLNLTGQIVKEVVNEPRRAGKNNISIFTSDLAAGTYIVKIQTEAASPQITKLVISK